MTPQDKTLKELIQELKCSPNAQCNEHYKGGCWVLDTDQLQSIIDKACEEQREKCAKVIPDSRTANGQKEVLRIIKLVYNAPSPETGL